jgi:type II secretion system protein I
VDRSRRGFTLVEALASVALLAVGIVAAVGTLGRMAHSEALLQEKERMARLADEKLQELIGTGDFQTVTSGDFQERGESRYLWSAALEPTGVENLEVVTVTVARQDERGELESVASQLIFIPPVATGGAP